MHGRIIQKDLDPKAEGKKRSEKCVRRDELSAGESSKMCIDSAGKAHLHAYNKSQNELPEKKNKLQESHNDSGELVQWETKETELERSKFQCFRLPVLHWMSLFMQSAPVK